MKRATLFSGWISSKKIISIHALVKRATRAAQKNYHGVNISIHALVKRATERHAGGVITDEISIHALVKRATQYTDPCL